MDPKKAKTRHGESPSQQGGGKSNDEEDVPEVLIAASGSGLLGDGEDVDVDVDVDDEEKLGLTSSEGEAEYDEPAADEAIFPCVLKILPNDVFNNNDPTVLAVDVLEGILKIGTPICIPMLEFIDIGLIASIENNHNTVDYAKKGQKLTIKIVGRNSEEQQIMFGRHFGIDDVLVSHISRRSIDSLKSFYRDDLTMEEWKLVMKLKRLFRIQ